MAGCIYLILAVMIGWKITGSILSEQKMKEKGITALWVRFPAAFGCGILLQSWAVYIAAWVLSVYKGTKTPLFGANLLVMGIIFVVLAVQFYQKKKKEKAQLFNFADKMPPVRETIFFLILLCFITWIMFYVFHFKNGYLYSGFSVFGDYAPHTAMMRSFSAGNNFPTQYPHFGGEDVKYHFMFQFLSGNLEYLGMRLDIAYNSVSILALWCFFMMLYSISQRITGKFAAGVLSVILVIFRSGTAFFQYVYEHWQIGDLWQTLKENTSFIGYSANENWGLWNFNVYLNQRHLAFGLILVAMAMWIFWDWLEKGCAHEEKGIKWLKDRFFTKEAWKCIQPEIGMFVGMILGLCSFWNGAAVIAGLLILMGFTVFSDGKLDYAITAVVTVVFSMLQSRIFVKGSVVSPAFYFGFLAEEKTLGSVVAYLFEISGFVFLGVIVLVIFLKREKRAAAISMLFPTIFAFVMSLTPDVNVNHKYVMISYAFLCVFWADAVIRLWCLKKRITGKLVAVLLTLILTITGIYDFVIILRDNDSMHSVSINMESELTSWLEEHMEKDDLILTPEYSMNEVTMSGAMLYLGWPYYAWSAGYDTYYRAEQAKEIYTADNSVKLQELVEKENITYILYEEGMELEGVSCREDVIAQTYPLVYHSEDGRIRIYGTEQ